MTDHPPDAPTREEVLTEGEREAVCIGGYCDTLPLFKHSNRCDGNANEVERIVAAHEAAAWDAGAEAGFDSHAPDDLTDVQSRNPYRGAR